ncbi:endo alpha-1,4 polygalactosaminidase [Granulosicoccus antarcticus]|uniref:Glycoside-hydrolase family GH114 TIM-barrel domain-containing protein n=1 Tax=Granulosicoccus antarcticus IMCC3135 TaxID=1192854 RepID=A0A2Z2NY61_9GAMM|nr:endo alpha-1,4 polygalactosaminidase [Granulosicoccus antarcticus]ASJ73780.1 hypothetical protein IMCC3135_18505 [Granulosicoccus antarcticus IMCC3135]
MKVAKFKNVALFATSFFLLSACSVDSEPDQDQTDNSKQQPLTSDENAPILDEQNTDSEEADNPSLPPAPSPVDVPVDLDDSIVESPSTQEDLTPNPIAPSKPPVVDSSADEDTVTPSTPGVTPEPAPEPNPEPEPTPELDTSNHYKPQLLVTWQLQLQGTLNTSYDAELYVMDLFDTSKSKIASLQSQGIAVICYFSAGTYEEWRSDASKFTASDLGLALADWPGERWLDVRTHNVRSIMSTRLDLASSKGCNGVDPDNVDGYSNPTGIDLDSSDQLAYNRYLSEQAHNRGLAIGLKNNVGQVEQLADDYDFTINESCDRYNECGRLDVFISQGKPVLHVEYRPELLNQPSAFSAYCQEFVDKQFSSLVLPRNLDDEYRLSCQ